jgi:hypothetical protein
VVELASVRVGGVEAPEKVEQIRTALRTFEPARIERRLAEMFDVKPVALMARAWTQLAAVREAVEKSIGPPSTDARVDLPKHTIRARLAPFLVLSVDGLDLCDIRFEVEFAATVTSATLTITGGELREVTFGAVSGSLSVSCEGAELREFTRELGLLPRVSLDPRLDLRALARPSRRSPG